VRACVRCGLSIGELATFCPVCGAAVESAGLVATTADEGEPVRGVHESEVSSSPASAAELDASPVTGHSAIPDDETDPAPRQLVADLAAESRTERAADVGAEPETAELEPSSRERKLAAVRVLLEAASGSEDADTSRAAALYQEAILGCLDAAEDGEGISCADHELLKGFDGLSALLERKGLAGEALEIVDAAATLGLLTRADSAAGGHREALKARREELRRFLFADSSQL
jgi:hypothetical protein